MPRDLPLHTQKWWSWKPPIRRNSRFDKSRALTVLLRKPGANVTSWYHSDKFQYWNIILLHLQGKFFCFNCLCLGKKDRYISSLEGIYRKPRIKSQESKTGNCDCDFYAILSPSPPCILAEMFPSYPCFQNGLAACHTKIPSDSRCRFIRLTLLGWSA